MGLWDRDRDRDRDINRAIDAGAGTRTGTGTGTYGEKDRGTGRRIGAYKRYIMLTYGGRARRARRALVRAI